MMATKEINEQEFRLQLGEEIRRLRERKKWTQERLARKVAIHRNSLIRYEAGSAEIPVMVFIRICVALGAGFYEVVERVLPDARQRIAAANGKEPGR